MSRCESSPPPLRSTQKAETGILLPNNQRQHRTSHAPKDVLPLRICANYCAPCQKAAKEKSHTAAATRSTSKEARNTEGSKREESDRKQGTGGISNTVPCFLEETGNF